MLPAMKMTEPYSPTPRAKASAKPGNRRRSYRRKDDAHERLPATGAQTRGRLFELAIEILQNRLHGAHDERQSDERQRDDDSQPRESNVNSERRERATEAAVRRVDRRQRDAGDRGRQGERQVDERVEEPLARKLVAHQDPSDERPEHEVNRSRDERRAEAEAVRGDGTRRGDDIARTHASRSSHVSTNVAASGSSTISDR